MSKRLVLAVFGLLLVSLTYGAERMVTEKVSAEELVNIDDSLSTAQSTFQLNLLEKVLHSNERSAENWWITWTALYAAATVGQGVVAVVTKDLSTRQDMIVGAGTTVLGVASQLFTPVSTDFKFVGADSLARLSDAEKQLRLTKGEEILKKQAHIAQAGKGWQVHALSGAVNLASGLITWIGFKRSFKEGVFNFALNTVITETQIWTQPFRAKKEYKQYLQAKSRGFATFQTNSPEWYGQVSPASCSFGIRF